MAVVSILIPCYNAGPFLVQTIESVLSQTFTDWELIILDDCSFDNSYEVACAYTNKDVRIRVHKNEKNLGMLENWNKGITFCHSPFFVKLDADDFWHPQMLEKAVGVLMSNPEVALVFSRFLAIDEKGVEIGTDQPLPSFACNKAFSCIPLVKEGPDKMLGYGIMLQGVSVMRREVFEKIGSYRYLLTKYTQAATDTEFYFRVGAHYKIYCINEVLYYYRVHQQSISASDFRNFLADQKLYEIRKVIIEYYWQCGYLSRIQYLSFLKKINKIYRYSLIANYRQNKEWMKLFPVLLKQFQVNPLETLFFYTKRLKERNGQQDKVCN